MKSCGCGGCGCQSAKGEPSALYQRYLKAQEVVNADRVGKALLAEMEQLQQKTPNDYEALLIMEQDMERHESLATLLAIKAELILEMSSTCKGS